MGGFLSALSGFGKGASEYGAQIRPILEQRRHDFANLIGQAAEQESNSVYRAQLLQHRVDLISGKPFNKIGPAVAKTLQDISLENSTVGQALGGNQPQPPPSVPGPAVGQPPGTGRVSQPQPAAQPNTNPLQTTGPILPMGGNTAPAPASPTPNDTEIPPVQAIPAQNGISPVQATPQIPPIQGMSISPERAERTSIIQEYDQRIRAATPVMRPYLQAERDRELDHLDTVEKRLVLQRNLELMKQTPEWSGMSSYKRENLQEQAYGFQPITMPFGLMRPVTVPGVHNGETAGPNAITPTGERPSKGVQYTIQRDLMSGQEVWYDTASRQRLLQVDGGGMGAYNPYAPNEGATTIPGAVAPSMNTPKLVNVPGGMAFTSPGENAEGTAPTPIPGAFNPSMAGTSVSAGSQQLPQGGTVSTRTTTKIPPGTVTPHGTVGSATMAQPAVQGQGAKLGPTIRPFDPSSRTDNIVSAIASDAANWKMATNAADKYQISKRMTELGLDPNNITGSMRERATNAKLILGHLGDVNKIIDEADKAGELGIVATRWNDFLTNKLGSDPTPDHIFSKLTSNREFLATAIAMAHGGLRGGSSPQMLEHWQAALSAKDGATLKAKLGQATKWMEGYASMLPSPKEAVDKGGKGGVTIPPVSGNTGDKTWNPALGKFE